MPSPIAAIPYTIGVLCLPFVKALCKYYNFTVDEATQFSLPVVKPYR